MDEPRTICLKLDYVLITADEYKQLKGTVATYEDKIAKLEEALKAEAFIGEFLARRMNK